MSNYTKEDKQAFEAKDKLYARQTAVNVVSRLYEGTGKGFNDVKEEMQAAYGFIIQDQPWAGKAANRPSLPLPTAEQQAVINLIQTKLDNKLSGEQLKEAILNFAEKQFGKRTYPLKPESVDIFVKGLNNE